MIRQTRRIVVVNSSKLLFPEISPETELSSKSRRSTDRNCANYRHLLVLVIDNESQCSNGYQSRKWVVRMRGLLWLRQLLTTENTSEQNRVPSPVMSLMHKFPSFVPVSPRERERERGKFFFKLWPRFPAKSEMILRDRDWSIWDRWRGDARGNVMDKLLTREKGSLSSRLPPPSS